METPVRAISRVRPLLDGESNRTAVNGSNSVNNNRSSGGVVEVAPAASQIILGHDHFCDFDAVFGPDVSQKDLYGACLEDLVTSFYEGYNVSVVGYGACQSGKTHTISGPDFLWAMNEEEFGLLPRAVRQLYRHMSVAEESSPRVSVSHVSVSYLLLSAGAVYDLLTSQSVLTPLPILADHKGSVMVPGLSSVECSSINEVLNCLEAGLLARHNHGSANAQQVAPHTHASFTITLQQRLIDKEGKSRVLCSRLNFVDLAGLDQQSSELSNMSLRCSNNRNTISDNLMNTLNVSSVSSVGLDLNNDANNSVGGNSYSHTEVLGGGVACHINKDGSFSRQQLQHQQQQEEEQRTDAAVSAGDQCPEVEDGHALDEDDDALCGDILEQSSDCVVVSADHECLASVIACLVDRNYSGTIPYSQSMLTQLLKEGLGGNCLTLVVVCASPSRKDLPATSLAMKYGGLARYIVNRPIINELTIDQEQLLPGFNVALSQPGENSVPNLTVPNNMHNNSNNNNNNNDNNGNAETIYNNETETVNRMEAEEMFRLQFAGWQLQQLVDGADSLLRTSLSFLPPALQAQVGAWLCRRSETIQCLGQQQSQSWPHQHRDDRTLHVIEEVSEPGDLKNSRTSCDDTDDGGRSSSVSSLGEEFYEQMAVLTAHFADCTGELVRQVQDKVDTFSEQVTSADSSTDDEPLSIVSGKSSNDSSEEKMDSERELCTDDTKNNSINLEDTKMNNDTLKSGEKILEIENINNSDNQKNYIDKKPSIELECNILNCEQTGHGSLSGDSDADMDTYESDAEESSSSDDIVINITKVARDPSPSAATVAVGPVSAVALHVHEANRRRQRELRETIREKESHMRTLQRGSREKEELQRQNQSRLLQLHNLVDKETLRLSETRKHAKTVRGDRMAEREASARMQQQDRILMQYRDRIKAVNSFINIIKATKTAPVELATLSSRLRELRCELEEVETSVRVDDQRKQQLQDLRNNRPRKSGRLSADEEGDDDNEDPLAGSSDPLSPLRGSAPPPPVRRERVAVGGEEHITLRRDNHRTKPTSSALGLSQPHKRRLITSSSEQCSSDGEAAGDRQLRAEVAHLREARDVLTTCRQRLNKRIHRGVAADLRWAADRRLLELDEAVEAVDSAIEYKNELICGRKLELAATSTLLMQGKLFDRLLNLSMEEIRTLLVKYFNRVIDIRIEFRKQEIAYTELELQYEDQSRHLQKLEWSYQQASLDMERRCAVQQKQYLHHLHKLLRHIDTQETATLQHTNPLNTRGYDSGVGVACELEMSLYYYKEQCTQLKTLIKQQQGRGHDYQTIYQQLHQPRDQQQKRDGERRLGIGMKLSSLGPGSPPATTATLVSHTATTPYQQQQQPDNRDHHPPDNVNVESCSGHPTTTTVIADIEPGPAPGGSHAPSLNSNPFTRRSHLEPRSRRRPPSCSSRWRGLTNGAGQFSGGRGAASPGESIPLTQARLERQGKRGEVLR